MDEDMEVGCSRNNHSWKMLNACNQLFNILFKENYRKKKYCSQEWWRKCDRTFKLSYLLPHSTFPQLEKQIHQDEEFARTLAMLDEEPQTKKVITFFTLKTNAQIYCQLLSCCFVCLFRLVKALMTNHPPPRFLKRAAQTLLPAARAARQRPIERAACQRM